MPPQLYHIFYLRSLNYVVASPTVELLVADVWDLGPSSASELCLRSSFNWRTDICGWELVTESVSKDKVLWSIGSCFRMTGPDTPPSWMGCPITWITFNQNKCNVFKISILTKHLIRLAEVASPTWQKYSLKAWYLSYLNLISFSRMKVCCNYSLIHSISWRYRNTNKLMTRDLHRIGYN